jgi:hypothetical protein
VALDRIREHDLEMNEGFLISQVDGRTDLRTLSILSGLGTSTTYRLILSMAERGLIEMPPTRPAGGR